MAVIIKVDREIDLPPRPGHRYIVIKSKNELVKGSEFVSKNKRVIIQQYINGYGCGVSGIFHNGTPILVGRHIRLRESFSSGGISTYCESRINEEAMKYTFIIMQRLQWTGIAMIEFKVDNEGIPYFMEINPRLWSTLPLYIKSGLNIPVVAYEVFVKNRTDGFQSDFEEGVRLRFLMEDLHAINTQYTSFYKLKKFAKIFFSIYHVKDGVFDVKDPLPFLIPLIYRITKKLAGKR